IVTGSSSSTNLTNAIVGSGITVVGPPTYVGATNQSGFFSGGLSAGIGIDTGILLTTGSVNNAPGPYNIPNATTSLFTAGDAQLEAAAGLGGGSTRDAASLSFQFTTAGGNLFFNYVFASEEYNEFVGSGFNDAFAFLLDGQNIALIPSTTTPVTINNVNL